MAKKDEEKKIVDKEFLDSILKSNTEMREKMVEMESKLISTPPPVPLTPTTGQDDFFQCSEIAFLDKIPPSPQDLMLHQAKLTGFKTKLEGLMREYKIGSIQAIILKKL